MADVGDIKDTNRTASKSPHVETGDNPSAGKDAASGGRIKGILKHSSESEQEAPTSKKKSVSDKEAHWDEMNILETYHPANKDYGHLKICEPPTPYHRLSVSEDAEKLDEATIAASLQAALSVSDDDDPTMSKGDSAFDDEGDDTAMLTEEEKARRDDFQNRRKEHYNEFQAAKLARELIKRELEELEKEDGEGR